MAAGPTSPSIGQLSEHERKQCNWLEREIDAKIGRYFPEYDEVHFVLDYSTNQRTADELAKRYREAGWPSVRVAEEGYGFLGLMIAKTLVIGSGSRRTQIHAV